MNTAPQLLREFALNLSWKRAFLVETKLFAYRPSLAWVVAAFWHVSTIFCGKNGWRGAIRHLQVELGKAEAAPIRCSTAQALSSSQQDNLMFGNPDGISASITRQISKMKAPRAVRRPWWLDHVQPLTDLAAEHVTFDQKSDVEHPKWLKFGTYKWDWTLRLSTSLCRRSIMKPSRRACWLGTKLCPIIRLLVQSGSLLFGATKAWLFSGDLRRLKLLIQFAVVGIWDPHGSDGFPSAGQRWGFHMISPSDLWVLVPPPSLLWTNGFPEGRNYQPLSFSTSAGTSNYLNVHVRNASICIQMHFVLVEPTNCRQL